MYDFDEIIDRKKTNAVSTDGFRDYLFKADPSMILPYEDDDLIRMWVADMEFATPDVVIEGIRNRLDKRIFGYTRVYSDHYYEAFVSWCRRRYDWSFEKEELVMSNGIIPALHELIGHVCSTDEKVLFLTPSYSYFQKAADFNHRMSICSDLINENGHYTIDFADLERKAADAKTTLFILCNPHNPTGRVWKSDELIKMAAIIERHQLWVISDEIHCDLLRCGQKHIPLGLVMPTYRKLITCMSPSKTFNLAGLMLSNIIIRDESLRRAWLSRHFNFDNPLSIAAAEAAYEKGGPWVDALQTYLDGNFQLARDYLARYLPQAKFTISEATYLAWVDLNAYFDKNENLSRFFAHQAGVLLEDGSMFIKNSDGCIRLNLASPRSIVEKGLTRIIQAVRYRQGAPNLIV